MGLFGGGNSSSKTDNYNYSSGADNGATSITAGGSVSILDGGAIEKSFGFGGQSLALAESANERTLSAMLDALQAQRDTQSEALTFAQRAGESAMNKIYDASKPDAAAMDKTMLLVGVVAVAVLLVVMKVAR